LDILAIAIYNILLGTIELVDIAIVIRNSIGGNNGGGDIDNNRDIRIGNIWSIVFRMGIKFKIFILGIIEINSTNDKLFCKLELDNTISNIDDRDDRAANNNGESKKYISRMVLVANGNIVYDISIGGNK